MEHSPAFHRQTRHLLKLLSREGTRLVPGGMGNFVLERHQRRTRETFDASLIATLARKDLLNAEADRAHVISDAGRAHAARAEAHARNCRWMPSATSTLPPKRQNFRAKRSRRSCAITASLHCRFWRGRAKTPPPSLRPPNMTQASGCAPT